MKALNVLIFILMLSCSGFSQNAINDSAVVHLNRRMAVSVIKDLVACDYVKKEATILTNTIAQQDVIISDKNRQITKREREIQKRDDLFSLQNKELEKCFELNNELKKSLNQQITLKKVNKWLYLGLGIAGGYVGFKALQ